MEIQDKSDSNLHISGCRTDGSKLFIAVPCLQLKAWQVQADQSKNVVMRLKSSADNSELQTEKAEDMVVCMTAEKFLVLYHGKTFHICFSP